MMNQKLVSLTRDPMNHIIVIPFTCNQFERLFSRTDLIQINQIMSAIIFSKIMAEDDDRWELDQTLNYLMTMVPKGTVDKVLVQLSKWSVSMRKETKEPYYKQRVDGIVKIWDLPM